MANKIKEAFFSERGLAGNVHKLPFDKLFSIDSVKRVGRSWGVKAHKCLGCSKGAALAGLLVYVPAGHIPIMPTVVVHCLLMSCVCGTCSVFLCLLSFVL